jgi:hypothetical protein
MEAFPPGAWEFTRPSVLSWTAELRSAHPSKGLDNAVDRIFDLGRRFDALNKVPMFENDDWSDPGVAGYQVPDEVLMPPPPVPSKAKKGKKPAPKEKPVAEGDDLVENDPPVCGHFIGLSQSNRHRSVCVVPKPTNSAFGALISCRAPVVSTVPTGRSAVVSSLTQSLLKRLPLNHTLSLSIPNSVRKKNPTSRQRRRRKGSLELSRTV